MIYITSYSLKKFEISVEKKGLLMLFASPIMITNMARLKFLINKLVGWLK
jgi:hypothetical protein